jgi:NAD(P)-dependent dehydrogenase (short-subunit alcohol dehydrogenase family)
MNAPLCIIAGVGPGNGLACCRRFRRAGYRTAILARDSGKLRTYSKEDEEIFPFSCDLSDPESINDTFAEIVATLGIPEVVIYNAGSGLFGAPLDVSYEDFEAAWRVNTLGLLSVCKTVAPLMIKNGGGSILVTGATASLRGGANFGAFSSAKGAQRNLAQSLGRSLGSQGIHVALVIIDGVIDMPQTRAFFPDKPDDFFLQPDAIAETFYSLSQQSSSAWTFETDLRPSTESW